MTKKEKANIWQKNCGETLKEKTNKEVFELFTKLPFEDLENQIKKPEQPITNPTRPLARKFPRWMIPAATYTASLLGLVHGIYLLLSR